MFSVMFVMSKITNDQVSFDVIAQGSQTLGTNIITDVANSQKLDADTHNDSSSLTIDVTTQPTGCETEAPVAGSQLRGNHCQMLRLACRRR